MVSVKDYLLFVILLPLMTGGLFYCLGRQSVSIPEKPRVIPEKNEVVEVPVPVETDKEPEPKESSPPPASFGVFRATFEVVTREPKDPDYAKKQARELRALVQSIPSVREVHVLRVEGVDGDEAFPIDFD